MAAPLGSESTTFTLDNMGRFLCNTLQEALDSAGQTVGGRQRQFDTIIIGGGTFGGVVAEHLFATDTTRSRRIPALNYTGLMFAIGGRSLAWGGWSPEPLDLELASWPAATRAELRARYFADA